jgi:DNA-directed RNA polymerase subunit E'/Rpb7
MENKKLYFFLAEDEEIIEAEFVKITDNIIELKFGNITYFVVKNLVFETKLNAIENVLKIFKDKPKDYLLKSKNLIIKMQFYT